MNSNDPQAQYGDSQSRPEQPANPYLQPPQPNPYSWNATPQGQGVEPPWEDAANVGYAKAFFQTMGRVLFDPVRAFRNMPPTGNVAWAFLYCYIVVIVYTTVGGYVLASDDGFVEQMRKRNMPPQIIERMSNPPVFAGFAALAALVLCPISQLIKSSLHHLTLMLLRGANRSFESTFKAVCYTTGSTGPIRLIPVIGGFGAFAWEIVALTCALSEQNGISRGKGFLAAILPYALLATCICACAALLFGLAAFAVTVQPS